MERDYKYENNILLVKCSHCGKYLTSDCFYKSKRSRFWLGWRCKKCFWKQSLDYQKKHPKQIYLLQKNHHENFEKQYGFNRSSFHVKTKRYVLKNWGYPEICPYCWEKRKIEIHHPFYRSFDDWKIFTFCCSHCHSKIHKGLLITTF